MTDCREKVVTSDFAEVDIDLVRRASVLSERTRQHGKGEKTPIKPFRRASNKRNHVSQTMKAMEGKVMRAMRLANATDSAVKFAATDMPRPKPGPGEVLVRVRAAGVTPTELIWYPTTHTKDGAPRTNAIPAHEFSGVVAELGSDVRDFHVGQEIYGMNDWFADGALAEYCIAKPSDIAPKPTKLSHIDAAAVPIAALTAWEGLFDRAHLQSGQRVLIHGGSGGVGIFAVQLAHDLGAHVIATAAARNRDFVKQLGADEFIDYTSQRFEDVARDIDVVFDGVGGETFERSFRVLKPGGNIVTIAASEEAAAETDERRKKAFFIVEPNQKQLIEITKLIDAGKLKPVVDAVVPLADAASAYDGSLKNRQARGKIVVDIAGA
jgi:NADPH:quinone reductase-like Zn-dependent oxidoreductase